MSGSPTDEELLERVSIDGRVAFAMAAAAATGGLIVLVDRVGAPERVIAGAGPAVLLIGMALIGVLVRSMRITQFYAAGRTIPPAYAGLAAAAVAIALAAPFIPPVADHYSGVGVFAGFFGGLACAAFISGPFLRKSGAFSISDLIARRFQHLPLRLGVAAVVGAAALLTALAGFETATYGLSTIAGLSRPASAAMIGLVLVLVTAPGGQAGVVWVAVAAGGVFVAAFGLPLLLLLLRGQAIALPIFGDQDAWRAAAGRIAEWQGDAGQPASLTLSLGMALGMASCAPLLAPLASVRDSAAAVRAGFGGMIWSAIAAALIAATVAGSTTALLDTMVGRRPERLPDAIYAASATGLVGICGVSAPSPAQARAACQNAPQFRGELRPQDVQTRGVFLVTALAPLASLGAGMSGLVWAAVVALGLALGAAGLLSASVALGNDAFHQVRDRSALTSRRLAITRGILVAAVVMGAAVVGARELDSRTLIGLTLALSAIVLAPLMLLSLWPRARGVDAFVALIVGLCAAEAILVIGEISVHRIAFGALAGFGAAVAAGFVSSLIGGGDRTRGYDFVAALFSGDSDALGPDKGA